MLVKMNSCLLRLDDIFKEKELDLNRAHFFSLAVLSDHSVSLRYPVSFGKTPLSLQEQ